MPKIGEGTYGCVHKPSLKCKNKNISYVGKISKIMDKEDAINELNEYKMIKSIDRANQFHQGEPIECDPIDDDNTRTEIDNCSKISNKDIAKFKLLIMNDGGLDLDRYTYNYTQTPENVNMFWIEARRVILGISVLVQNGVVHHDLKPQNIVYFEDMHRMNFIDFGLMTTMKNITKKCNQSVYNMALLHITFPLEMQFLNKNDYSNIADNPREKLPELLKRILQAPQKRLFSLISEEKDIIQIITDQYTKMITEDITLTNYDKFLDKSIRTIDVYGLGVTFLYVLGVFRKHMNQDLANELRDLFLKAIHARVSSRITADELLQQYDEILKRYGLEIQAINKCVNLGKELNPITNRCTKKLRH